MVSYRLEDIIVVIATMVAMTTIISLLSIYRGLYLFYCRCYIPCGLTGSWRFLCTRNVEMYRTANCGWSHADSCVVQVATHSYLHAGVQVAPSLL